MTHFTRFIGIDWSGAAGDDDRVGLRVVVANRSGPPRAVAPPTNARAKNWKRDEVRHFLGEALQKDAPKTLVGIDSALGYPAGSDEAVFGVRGWRATVAEIAEVAKKSDTAREMIDVINTRHSRGRGVPFFSRRKDISECDWWRAHHDTHGFFTETGVSYYRLVDTLIPQAISIFYMGPGPMVGGHALTCLNTLHPLLEDRDNTGDLDFGMWLLEENWRDRKHLIAECYPAILPANPDAKEAANRDHLDAVKIASWLQNLPAQKLEGFLNLEDGAEEGLRRVLAQEGWVLGVVAPAGQLHLMELWNGPS